jgi:hypothetical protein
MSCETTRPEIVITDFQICAKQLRQTSLYGGLNQNCQLKVKPLSNAKLSLKEVLEIGIFPLLPACFVLIGKCSQI